MLPGDPVFTWLQDCLRNDLPVRLINAYRGIPIANSARIISVSEENAVFSVNEYQAVCLTLDGKTHIQYPGTPDVLRARVVSVDFPKKEACVTEFVKTAGSLGKRLCTRVQPTEPIAAEMRLGDHLHPCHLVDVSLIGVGAITPGTFPNGDLDIHKGARVQFHFTLPPTHRPVQLPAQINSVVILEDSNQRRLGCKIFPDSKVELLLLEYVALRRDELMRELSTIYTTMLREQLKVAPFL